MQHNIHHPDHRRPIQRRLRKIRHHRRSLDFEGSCDRRTQRSDLHQVRQDVGGGLGHGDDEWAVCGRQSKAIEGPHCALKGSGREIAILI